MTQTTARERRRETGPLPRAHEDIPAGGGLLRRILPQGGGEVRTLILYMCLAAAVAVGVTYLLPSRYVAETAILLDSYSDLSSLLSLAQSSDILPGGILPGQSRKENGYSYASICTSRATLTDLLGQQTGRRAGETYLEVFAPRNGSPQRKLETALTRLKKRIATRFEQRSGVFLISVSHESPAIATGVANLLAAELRRFNTDVRTTRARHAVGFVADRLEEAKETLTKAENGLAAFRSANARIGNAPGLLLQQSRLEREVHFNENIYALLSRQYELARIQEKNETPVFTVMDPATEPTRPRRMPRAVTALVAGLFTGLVYLLGKSGLAALRLDRGTGGYAATS